MAGAALFLLLQTVLSVPSSALPSPPDGPAAEIRYGLETADLGVMQAEICAESRRDYAHRLEPLRGRFMATWKRAEPLYGRLVIPPFGGVGTVVPCARADRKRYLDEIEQGIERADAALQQRLAGMPGLWLGPLHLCRDTVEHVRLVEDWDGSKVPAIRFAPSFHAAMRAETESRVGQPLGLYLDGKLIGAPTVMEPIAAEMQISGPQGTEEVERIRAAAALPC